MPSWRKNKRWDKLYQFRNETVNMALNVFVDSTTSNMHKFSQWRVRKSLLRKLSLAPAQVFYKHTIVLVYQHTFKKQYMLNLHTIQQTQYSWRVKVLNTLKNILGIVYLQLGSVTNNSRLTIYIYYLL
jgi:hypothetical protein